MTFLDYAEENPTVTIVSTEADLAVGLEKSAEGLANKINARISRYQAEVRSLGAMAKRNGCEEYRMRMFKHFLGENQALLDRLEEYRKDGLHQDCCNLKCFWASGALGLRKLDAFAMKFGMLDVRVCDDLSNKFAMLPISSFEKLRNFYIADRSKFYDEMHKVLEDTLFEQLIQLAKKHHLLNKRVTLLEDAINLFRGKRHQSAALIFAAQIEGILEDCLCDQGCDRHGFESQTMGSKAEALSGLLKTFIGAEYYTYSLPILRNELAHGRVMTDDKIKDYATSVALDVWGLVNQVTESRDLKTNLLVEKIKAYSASGGNDRRVLALEYIDLYRKAPIVPLPKFYNLEQEEENLVRVACDPITWNVLEQRCEDEDALSKYLEVGKFLSNRRGMDGQVVEGFRTRVVRKIQERKRKIDKILEKIKELPKKSAVGKS